MIELVKKIYVEDANDLLELTDEVTRKTPTAFSEAENYNKIQTPFYTSFQDIENIAFELLKDTEIDASKGSQLDLIGEILGILRSGLSDDEYREKIKAELVIRNSTGTQESLITAVKTIIKGDSELDIRECVGYFQGSRQDFAKETLSDGTSVFNDGSRFSRIASNAFANIHVNSLSDVSYGESENLQRTMPLGGGKLDTLLYLPYTLKYFQDLAVQDNYLNIDTRGEGDSLLAYTDDGTNVDGNIIVQALSQGVDALSAGRFAEFNGRVRVAVTTEGDGFLNILNFLPTSEPNKIIVQETATGIELPFEVGDMISLSTDIGFFNTLVLGVETLLQPTRGFEKSLTLLNTLPEINSTELVHYKETQSLTYSPVPDAIFSVSVNGTFVVTDGFIEGALETDKGVFPELII